MSRKLEWNIKQKMTLAAAVSLGLVATAAGSYKISYLDPAAVEMDFTCERCRLEITQYSASLT